jgi:hypothetical protein
MSANKRGRKQRKTKDIEVTSKSSAEQGEEKSMEVYDGISHNIETPRNSMCESENDRNPSERMRVTQCYNIPSQVKPAGVY